jgi:hypothetical protein
MGRRREQSEWGLVTEITSNMRTLYRKVWGVVGGAKKTTTTRSAAAATGQGTGVFYARTENPALVSDIPPPGLATTSSGSIL